MVRHLSPHPSLKRPQQPLSAAHLLQVAPVAAALAVAEKGFFGWLKSLFGVAELTAPAPAQPAPVVAKEATKEARGEQRRDGRGGRGGRNNSEGRGSREGGRSVRGGRDGESRGERNGARGEGRNTEGRSESRAVEGRGENRGEGAQGERRSGGRGEGRNGGRRDNRRDAAPTDELGNNTPGPGVEQ